jgi:hypothetical protein
MSDLLEWPGDWRSPEERRWDEAWRKLRGDE